MPVGKDLRFSQSKIQSFQETSCDGSSLLLTPAVHIPKDKAVEVMQVILHFSLLTPAVHNNEY
jgi:hypothetical protein